MKRLLQLLLILIVVLIAAGYFLVDDLLKTAIEREGSNALKARLDVGGVSVHLFPTAITLRDVAATNPRAPMNSLVTAESIRADISLAQLLNRHIVVEHAVLAGLRFDQPRARSGAIPCLTPEPTATSTQPGIALPDVRQLAADARARAQEELTRIEQSLQQINETWESRLQALPDVDPQQLDEYDRLLRADWVRVNQLVASARDLPNAELSQLLASAGLDLGHFDHLTQALLASELAPLVAQITALAGGGDLRAANANAVGWPILARRVDLDGELALGASRLPFKGRIDNVTPQPALWDLPLTFSFSGAGQLNVNGTLDYRHAGDGQMQLVLDRFPVAKLALIDNPQLGIVLERALASARGLLTLRGGDIDFELGSQFHDAVLAVRAGDPTTDPNTAQRVAELLSDVHELDLRLRVRGRPDSPQVRIDSSLDRLLADTLDGEAHKQAGQLTEKLREELQEQLAPQLARIQQQTAAFNATQERLRRQRETLPQPGR